MTSPIVTPSDSRNTATCPVDPSSHPDRFYLVGVVEGHGTIAHAAAVRKAVRYAVGVALLAVAVGVGVYLLHDSHPLQWFTKEGPSRSDRTAPQRETGNKSHLGNGQLPSAIRAAKPDPSFAAATPGWERYLADTGEFRVFREQGTVKAIQVIAFEGKTLTDSFFREFLREICGEEQRTTGRHSEQNGYDLENGALPCGVQFTIYRKSGSSGMIAFVVSLP